MIDESLAKALSPTTFALWTSRLAVAFPLAAIAVARIHYALTTSDLSGKTQAWLLLLTFPFCLACIFDLALASKSTGSATAAIIGWSIGGIVLNVLFFVAVGSSY